MPPPDALAMAASGIDASPTDAMPTDAMPIDAMPEPPEMPSSRTGEVQLELNSRWNNGLLASL